MAVASLEEVIRGLPTEARPAPPPRPIRFMLALSWRRKWAAGGAARHRIQRASARLRVRKADTGLSSSAPQRRWTGSSFPARCRDLCDWTRRLTPRSSSRCCLEVQPESGTVVPQGPIPTRRFVQARRTSGLTSSWTTAPKCLPDRPGRETQAGRACAATVPPAHPLAPTHDHRGPPAPPPGSPQGHWESAPEVTRGAPLPMVNRRRTGGLHGPRRAPRPPLASNTFPGWAGAGGHGRDAAPALPGTPD
jgi:hypothetical protein